MMGAAEMRVTVNGLVGAAHPQRCQVVEVTLALEVPIVWGGVGGSLLHLDSSEHLGNAFAVSYDAVEVLGNANGDLERMNDDGVTMIGHPASDSWNVDAVGYCVDGRVHSNRVGRVHGRDPFFHNLDHGHEYSRASRDYCRCRENDRACHSLFGPFYQVHNAYWGHNVCHRDDDRLALARQIHSEKDRVSPCNEDDSQGGRSHRRVDGNEGEGIYGESADGDLGQGQSQAWVEVEEWKTLAAFSAQHPQLRMAFLITSKTTLEHMAAS